MGTFVYDSSIRVDFEDRLLMHLQLVIAAKLRRDESFPFTWTKSIDDGGGRTTVWVDRRVPIVFDYASSVVENVDRRWVDDLTATTFRPSGLQIVPEPGTAPTRSPASSVTVS